MDINECITWLKILRANTKTFPEVSSGKKIEALTMAIKALEQEPCEDAISRQSAQAKIKSICDKYRLSYEDGERKTSTVGSAYALGHALDDLPCVRQGWKGKETIESIPYLMHKEMDIPISECQKAYDVAIEYLRNKAKIEG